MDLYKRLYEEEVQDEYLDMIYSAIDDKLRKQLFSIVDHSMIEIDWDRINIDAGVLILMTTKKAKDSLPHREDAVVKFAQRVWKDIPNRAYNIVRYL